MSQSGSMSQNRHPIARCPTCGKDMVVTHISPERPGFERRTLRCVTCGKETVWMARIASSTWLERPWNPR
jgi:endogenous inhibitor of DNA gyrase (YacG/DUF329 family)